MEEHELHHATLAPHEAALFEALIEIRCAQAQQRQPDEQARHTLASATPEQVRLAQAWLELIAAQGVSAPPLDLVQRTLTRVNQTRRFEQLAERAQGSGAAWRFWRLPEVAAVAAMLIIGLSLLWPAMAQVRNDARRIACNYNLGVAGQGLAAYAADNTDYLPRRDDADPHAIWWNVGNPRQSNSANLRLLASGGYVPAQALNCPANASASRQLSPQAADWPHLQAVSYSLQNQNGTERLRLSQANRLALMADRNPLFAAAGTVQVPFRPALPPTTPSQLHRHQGQNVLLGDGAAVWQSQPLSPTGDNIWLAGGIERYAGAESPSGFDDSFLVP